MSLTIKQQSAIWDKRIERMYDLVVKRGFRAKELAEYYETSANSIRTVLHRREISLIRWRHEFAKDMPFTWSRSGMTDNRRKSDIELFVDRKELAK